MSIRNLNKGLMLTNREVHSAIVDEMLSIDLDDTDTLKRYVAQAVNFTKNQLGITTGMASRYVFQIVVGIKNGTIVKDG